MDPKTTKDGKPIATEAELKETLTNFASEF